MFTISRSLILSLILTAPSQATEILSVDRLSQWYIDCAECRPEAQFDVLQGDVTRLAAQGDEVSLKRRLMLPSDHPQLKWHWSTEQSLSKGVLIRVTLNFADTSKWPERVLHYVWDNSRQQGERERLSDFEQLLVVTGEDTAAGDWYQVSRDLSADWQEFYNDPLPVLESVEISLNMPGQNSWNDVYISDVTMTEQSPALQPAVATDE